MYSAGIVVLTALAAVLLVAFGGVTDALIKQYISRFDEEAKKFAKFAK